MSNTVTDTCIYRFGLIRFLAMPAYWRRKTQIKRLKRRAFFGPGYRRLFRGSKEVWLLRPFFVRTRDTSETLIRMAQEVRSTFVAALLVSYGPFCCGRLTNSLMMHGRNNGKKLMAVRIVKHSMEIIHLLTDQNPIQVVVDAIINR